MRRQYVTHAPHFVVRIDGRVTRPTPNYLALRASEDCECRHLVNVENGKPDPPVLPGHFWLPYSTPNVR